MTLTGFIVIATSSVYMVPFLAVPNKISTQITNFETLNFTDNDDVGIFLRDFPADNAIKLDLLPVVLNGSFITIFYEGTK